jgi:hypothetical protein
VELEGELDRLFQLPLADFIAGRNALAKRLRAGDRSDEAAAVSSLRKPPLSVWAVNRLARLAPELMAELRATGEALRSAQQRGHGYREASTARRRAVTRLVARAEELLAEGGHAATAATLLRITKTLEAVAIHGEAGSGPPPGRLTEDLLPPGVEGLTVFGVAPAGASTTKGRPAKSPRAPAQGITWGPRRVEPAGAAAKGAEEAKRKKVTARERARARDAVERAQRRVTEGRHQERRTVERQKRARAAEERAEHAVGEAERALEKARQRLTEASATARAFREEVEEAAAERRRAEEALDAAREALARLDEGRGE